MDGQVRILDQGYAQLVESWGSDERVIESARMSTAKGFLGWEPRSVCKNCGQDAAAVPFSKYCGPHDANDPIESTNPRSHQWASVHGDEKLLKFLWDNQHCTPFEMAGLTIEVKAPIMVFREWHRHRVPFGYNEMSARYVPLPNENYVPTVERVLMANQVTTNKQAQGSGRALTEDDAIRWLAALADAYDEAQRVYELGLRLGVPKELARLCVPVGRYSAMRATGNLRGWLGFLKLRGAVGAQWEIRQYAHAVAAMVKDRFPRTYEVARESVGMP